MANDEPVAYRVSVEQVEAVAIARMFVDSRSHELSIHLRTDEGCRQALQLAAYVLSLPPRLYGGEMTPTHRHKKRGTEYVLIGYGKMQAENWHDMSANPHDFVSVDMREVAIYRSATDPAEIWVRPREEFEDGRFEALASTVNHGKH